MGLYDSVVMNCPQCGLAVEAQSKAGECNLNVFDRLNAPLSIKADIIGYVTQCTHCGKSVKVVGSGDITIQLEGVS